MNGDLLTLFDATRGIVCAIGAGGKKSTLCRLAAEGRGRVALTATVGTSDFPPGLGLREVVASPEEIATRVLALPSTTSVAYACPRPNPGRLAGVAPDTIAALHKQGGFDRSLVKADGARMRWLKAPRTGEPVLPPGCETVIAVLSARAFGQALSERIAHRLDRVLEVTGASEGDIVTPELVASLFTRRDGLLMGVEAPTVVPMINMVDNDELEVAARATAALVLASTKRFERFILASMRRTDNPVVAVIER